MSYENADDLKFYIRNGWCPGNAGKDARMGVSGLGSEPHGGALGQEGRRREFERRAHGWTPLFNAEQGLILPKKQNGEWLHLDPLDGRGWVEANGWRAHGRYRTTCRNSSN